MLILVLCFLLGFFFFVVVSVTGFWAQSFRRGEHLYNVPTRPPCPRINHTTPAYILIVIVYRTYLLGLDADADTADSAVADTS